MNIYDLENKDPSLFKINLTIKKKRKIANNIFEEQTATSLKKDKGKILQKNESNDPEFLIIHFNFS